MITVIKVKKFKLDHLTPEQILVLEEWLETCRRVWNLGLSLLLEQEDLTVIPIIGTKEDGKPLYGKFRVPRSRFAIRGTTDMPRPVRSSATKVNGEWAECCWIVAKHRTGGMQDGIRVGSCCPIAIPEWQEPRLGMDLVGKYTLQYHFTQKNVKELYPYLAKRFCEVPSWFIRGVCESLSKAWQNYKSGKMREPRFKRASDTLGSLTFADAKKLEIKPIGPAAIGTVCRDGQIRLPKIGWTPIKWLYHNWGERQFSKFTLVKAPDSWYIHLTGEFEIEERDRPQTAKTTLELFNQGDVLARDHRGVEYSVLPKFKQRPLDEKGTIQRLDSEILKLQQRISRQERRHRTDPNLQNSPLKKTHLKRNRSKMAKLRARKATILRCSRTKIAHFVSERSKDITIQTPSAKLIPVPDPNIKPGTFDPVHYDPNGATLVSEINKARATLASGEFVALIKSEAAERSQSVTEVKPKKPAKTKRKKKSA